ncbi:MAG: hypothetical protein U9M94_00250 [Patescibacteria group bacterium]|nr:hypothetical protein [Patescibacteria group bacterium]
MPIKFDKTFKYLLIATSLLISWGAIIYRLYKLNIIGVIIILILAVLSFIIILYFTKKFNKQTIIAPQKNIIKIKKQKKDFFSFFMPAIYLSLFTASVYILFTSRTAEAIISPWQVINPIFYSLYFALTVCLAFIIIKKKPLANLLIIFHYFLSFSIALIIYKIGYGFDPFIHQATEELIAKTGEVNPKPFYYLGQYGLVVLLNKITLIKIIYLDKILVPFFSGIILPLAMLSVLTKWLENRKIVRLTILFLLILPFSFFIVTTPQNLAYIFLILTLIYSLDCKRALDYVNIFLLSLSAFFIHPLAGIPALLFACLVIIYDSKIKIKKIGYFVIYSCLATALPLAFFFFEKNTKNAANASANTETFSFNFLNFSIPDKKNIILNTVYFFIFNIKYILIFLAVSGIIIAIKHKKECKILSLYFFSSLALFFSYFLSAKLPYAFLINYEQANYSKRILSLACFFLLPFIIIAFYQLIIKIFAQNKIIKYSLLGFFCFLISISLYSSYPRCDHYFNSHGYSVSKSDLNAVKWIDDNAPEDFIVLANQQTSVAGLYGFGFKKYYQSAEEEIFYYPIPTGGSLYQYYLDMVYEKPSRNTMENAMNLTGVNIGYFVLNKYWWAFDKILAEAKLEADSWQEIDNGEVYILIFEKKKNTICFVAPRRGAPLQYNVYFFILFFMPIQINFHNHPSAIITIIGELNLNRLL